MTLSTAAATAKAAMDNQLDTITDLINVKMGVSLYDELCACGMITNLPYDPIIFSGAFPFPSYGHGRFVFYDAKLAPYEFIVGDGGMSV